MLKTLEVERTDLREALKYLKPYIRRKKPVEACLVFDSGVLILQAGPVSARMRAKGEWDGTARFSGLVVLGLHEGLPDAETLTIKVEDERLKVGGFSFPCRWEAVRVPPITLPLDASTNLILSYRFLYTEAELTRAGLIADLRIAEKKRDRAMAAAAKVLAPLEITAVDLMEYHEQRLRQQFVGGDTEADDGAKAR